ncbi:NAD-dependent epimerase/dehydratase family protein [Nocardioides sp.]|uniref:NAD-dependent epimerase/dehydratase family protein n=1 Tax=Nocardioides sp. TaxID=35761 RepID=UPI002EDA9E76
MRIVITGATGNVGSALVRRLVADGRHEVVGVARRLPSAADDPVEWHRVDLTDDADGPGLAAAVRGADAVVHLAWGFQPSHRVDHLERLGVGGTRRVLDALQRAGVGHLVHLSSLGAYSPKRDEAPVTEDYPTDGVPSSAYSRHKVAAERLLDAHAGDTLVTRMRPGIIGQRTAASGLLRYGVPMLVPAAALRRVPVVPLDGAIVVAMVHADDVADAIVRSLEGRVGGAFNLAAGAVTADEIAAALGGRRVQVPAGVLRAAASATWHARLQQVDPGWIDLARHAPTLDTGRAERELGWSPTRPAPEVLAEVLDGLRDAAAGDTPVLRERRVARELAAAVTRGPVSHRREP